jgi:hypothetical protein
VDPEIVGLPLVLGAPHRLQQLAASHQSALALKLALKFRPDTVVVNVPYLMGSAASITEEQLGMDRSQDPPYAVKEVLAGTASDSPAPVDDH